MHIHSNNPTSANLPSTCRTRLRLILLGLVLALLATACGSASTSELGAGYGDELDQAAAGALDAPASQQEEPTPQQVTAAFDDNVAETPTQPTPAEPTPTPATPVPQATAAPATPPAATPIPAQPTATAAAVSTTSADYDGVLPAWFSIPDGFVPTGAELTTTDIDVLTIDGTITTSFVAVCDRYGVQAKAAGIPLLAGTCNTGTVLYGQSDQSGAFQTSSRNQATFVFIGFELVDGGAGNAPPLASTTQTNPTPATSSTSLAPTGIFPDWYQPPTGLEYVSHRDNSRDERRIQTNLNDASYTFVCTDFRLQAAVAGFVATFDRPCDHETIRWSTLETTSGIGAEIQDVTDLSYDVLFVFDLAAYSIDGAAPQSASPTPVPTPTTATDDTEGALVPGWFSPTVTGTDLGHKVEDGVYTLAATGDIAPGQSFTGLCAEFEQQATAAGWLRESGDECGEDIFDGASFRDPVSGFEAKVRNYRGSEVVYTFEVADNLTAIEITAIALDPELYLVPAGFMLSAGDEAIAVGESIDSTGAYNSGLRVQGPNSFGERCDDLLAIAQGATVVLGSCDSANEIITLSTGTNTTVILESDTYTFVTR